MFERIKFLLCLMLILGSVSVCFSQEDAYNSLDSRFGEKGFYRNEMYGGIIMHSGGWGVNFRKAKRIDALNKWTFSGTLSTLKHPKEEKTYNSYYDDQKGFIYGKLNTVVIFNPSYGRQVTLFQKETKGGVQVGYYYEFGPSFGLIKPVYLEIAYPSVPNISGTPRTERYDPEVHTIDKIYGKAPVLKGMEELKVEPGIHTQFGLNFEYSPMDEFIRAVEAGVTLDAFYRELPIMAFADNKTHFFDLSLPIYFGIYLNWQVGKKYVYE